MSLTLKALVNTKILILDGAMGTEIQKRSIPHEAWEDKEGCNELLNVTASETIAAIYSSYLSAGADIIKTNTFGAMNWVLEEYDIASRAYELAYEGTRLAKQVTLTHSTPEKPRFVAGSIGPGTKLPSLGHIDYDTMYLGYCEMVTGLIDGGCDIFLVETCQDPLQIKCAIHAIHDTQAHYNISLPIMVSVTMETTGTMLIGTDVTTIATILEPFDIFSLGFNCGTGPDEVRRHVETLSQLWNGNISIHANAGLPQNRGGYTFYPMSPDEFALKQYEMAHIHGVTILGGCCGTTPQHILALSQKVAHMKPIPPQGNLTPALASLFNTYPLKQDPAPFFIGERSNATGSKAFRELLLAEDYEGALSVGLEQVRSGAHGIDLSVAFAGRDETHDMKILSKLYASKLTLPLMPDSTQLVALENALKNIGGRAIINSANLEDGEEKFDAICRLAKRYGAALVCLTIDEEGMAKTQAKKVEIAERMYQRAINVHQLRGYELVFDLLTFTVGSGDSEYFTAAIETIEAIREFHLRHPEVGFVLGVSNISFGLAKHAREYLNSVFLSHCVDAGLSMAIVNVKNTIPIYKIDEQTLTVCNDLLFNHRHDEFDPLFAFIEYFKTQDTAIDASVVTSFETLSLHEKIATLLIDGDKERMLKLLPDAKNEIPAEIIVNEILIEAMKTVGELFGSGKMQLPFVLQSAEVMKASVDYLTPFLPKSEKSTKTTLILGTVKGDVHDVGKNLVDIILTNNGYHVVNIGIKADINDFIRALKEHNADAIGMSGLLVKSTLVMKENLEELQRQGINVPVILGGAALTKKFVEESCRSVYDGAIFYCRDAFEGIVAMSRIEKGGILDVTMHDYPQENNDDLIHTSQLPSTYNVILPSPAPIPQPPFWGRKVVTFDSELKATVFEWINKRVLYKQRWGYTAKGVDKNLYHSLIQTKVDPLYHELKDLFLSDNLFDPTILYGYWEVQSLDNQLIIFENNHEIERLIFPRQRKSPHRSLADYFHTDRKDCLALLCVSAGQKISDYERQLFSQGEYTRYNAVHGLGVELAEALAEMAHKMIRCDLNILRDEESSLTDVRMKNYQGKRYAPGYPACPELELNRFVFDRLKPEEFGIELSETFQIHPEQSTVAFVVHHPKALYYAL